MHFFDSLPSVYHNPSCGICLKKYKANTVYTCLQLTCGHIFHKHCIVPWLNDNHCCPYCRKKTIMVQPLNNLLNEAAQKALIEFNVLGKGFKIIIVAFSVIAVCFRLLDWATESVSDYCPDSLNSGGSPENWDHLVLAGALIIFGGGIFKGGKHLLNQIIQPKAKEIKYYKPAN